MSGELFDSSSLSSSKLWVQVFMSSASCLTHHSWTQPSAELRYIWIRRATRPTISRLNQALWLRESWALWLHHELVIYYSLMSQRYFTLMKQRFFYSNELEIFYFHFVPFPSKKTNISQMGYKRDHENP
jgi:hypothetical protein